MIRPSPSTPSLQLRQQEFDAHEQRSRIEQCLVFIPTLQYGRLIHQDSYFRYSDDNDPPWEELSREYVIRLGDALRLEIEQIQEGNGDSIVILEVGAGRGDLTRALKAYFSLFPQYNIFWYATDKKGNKDMEVEDINADAAFKKYKPTIVLFSWAPNEVDWAEKIELLPSVELYVAIGEPKIVGRPMNDVMQGTYVSENFEPELVESLIPYQLCWSDFPFSPEDANEDPKKYYEKHGDSVHAHSRTIFFRRIWSDLSD